MTSLSSQAKKSYFLNRLGLSASASTKIDKMAWPKLIIDMILGKTFFASGTRQKGGRMVFKTMITIYRMNCDE